jgi:hypothetical protein
MLRKPATERTGLRAYAWSARICPMLPDASIVTDWILAGASCLSAGATIGPLIASVYKKTHSVQLSLRFASSQRTP